MTKEEKQLLLEDLCVRLSHGVVINTPNGDGHLCSINQTIFGNEYGVNIEATKRDYFNDNECDIKPYLRPMSSITEEEKEEIFELCEFAENEDWEGRKTEMYCITIAERFDPIHSYDTSFKFWGINMKAIDWLNAHHFDYRCLIERGLAIEAPKGMYN